MAHKKTYTINFMGKRIGRNLPKPSWKAKRGVKATGTYRGTHGVLMGRKKR